MRPGGAQGSVCEVERGNTEASSSDSLFAAIEEILEGERGGIEEERAELEATKPDLVVAPLEDQKAHGDRYVHLDGRSEEVLRISEQLRALFDRSRDPVESET
jgi:hypothetical protein